MSAHKHTPGEWHVGGPHKCTIYDKYGQRIANSFEGVMAAQRTDSECAANARLIAAAPELLDACMAMLEWDDRENDHAVDFYARMDLCRAAFDKARAAIAKAMGEYA